MSDSDTETRARNAGFEREALPWLDDGGVEALSAVRLHGELARDGFGDLLSRIDLGPALQRALDTLQEPFRSAVILVDVDDQSYDAASEIMGVPIGTVRSRLFRGRRMLQESLIAYARDAGFTAAVPGGKAGERH